MANEKRLIERFAARLKEAYPQNDRNNHCPAIYYDDFCDIVDEVTAEMMDSSTVDAVEVVRCIECEHGIPLQHSDNVICGGRKVPKNGYCDRGIRRTDHDPG